MILRLEEKNVLTMYETRRQLQQSSILTFIYEVVIFQIVFNYEGISERRKINPALTRVIRGFFNENYADLRPEVAQRVM